MFGRFVYFFLILVGISVSAGSAISPNPCISYKKPVFGSALNGASNLVNGQFGESAWIVQNNSWAAIDLGQDFSKILFIWNCTNYMWSDQIATPICPQNREIPKSYEVSVSSNSTNGADGTWTKALSVTGNLVANRAHAVEGEAVRWVKMTIVNSGGCQIDELEVYDIAQGAGDTWLFAGTSITANAFKGSIPQKTFADLVHENHPAFTPAIIRGGIGCIKSPEFARDFSLYVQHAGPMRYWAIEMGTNDGYGGSGDKVDTFKVCMQRVIDSCKAHGIVPILARAMGTNEAAAGWQIHSGFVKAIDDLTKENNLPEGPDYYTYFSTHPSDLDGDGVHPSAGGGQAMQRLWAEKMAALYTGTAVVKEHFVPVRRFGEARNLFSGAAAIKYGMVQAQRYYTLDGKTVVASGRPLDGHGSVTTATGWIVAAGESTAGSDGAVRYTAFLPFQQ